MAYVDPALPPKLTKAEKVRVMQEACIAIPCKKATDGNPPCPFCPQWNKILKETK